MGRLVPGLLLFTLWLAGCGSLPLANQIALDADATPLAPTATVSATATATVTATATAAPTATPTATATASPSPTREPTPTPTALPASPTAEPARTVRMVAVGDMLPHDAVNLSAYDPALGDYDYTKFMLALAPIFGGADLRLCNQEAPSSPHHPITGYPRFNAPPAFARDLHRQGCNLIQLANNHLADYGQSGIDGTLETWDALPTLAVAGANRSAEEQLQPRHFTAQGIRFAFVAFTEFSNHPDRAPHGLNLLSEPLVQAQLESARAGADVVIAAVHWGPENVAQPSASQRYWAQRLADEGADVIIGSGPHVLQPVEWLPTARGQTLVWFSLGNLLSTQFELAQRVGGIAQMDVRLESGQLQIEELAFYPTYMHYLWPPDGDSLHRYDLRLLPLRAAGEAPIIDYGWPAETLWAEVEQTLNQSADVLLLDP